MVEVAWLIPLLPLAAFLLVLASGRRTPGQGAGISVLMLGLSTLLSVGVLLQTSASPATARFHGVDVPWLHLGVVSIDAGYLVDPLTAVMLVVVTVVALMVQVFSIGYMKGDPRFPLFYAYLNLFTAAMLGLVLASNLLLLYACWEVMGLASYLLIGFWFEKPAAMRAAKKAFMVTRIGDMGFFFGILSLIAATGTTNLSELVLGDASARGIAAGPALTSLKAAAGGGTALGWIAMLIFCGAIGKSAQFPLHVWLPDAMEGPTPVSALIHAATMVAAGVFLVARMYPVFDAAGPVTLLGITARPLSWVAGIGITTAILASLVALTQADIKRVLAYSTISQLGFMVFGLGIGAFTAALFHLMTHAFFKALLFLGSGSVIHGSGTQDIWEMGGLRGRMPLTHLTFLVGTLALAGIPPFSGFWSKDAILDHSFHASKALWVLGLISAFLTAFYMIRLMKLVFGGEWRGPVASGPSPDNAHVDADVHSEHRDQAQEQLAHPPHESPPVMTVPLVALAAVTAVVGLVGTPFADGFGSLVHPGVHLHAAPVTRMGLGLMALSTVVALAGIAAGVWLYPDGRFRLSYLKRRPFVLGCYRLSYHKFYFDELYWSGLVVPTLTASRGAALFDRWIIDGIVNAVGAATLVTSKLYRLFDVYVIDFIVNLAGWIPRQVGRGLRYLQTGQVANYLLGLCFGALVLFWLFLRLP
jgi:NADH-quinone oxidoreductase subunit L